MAVSTSRNARLFGLSLCAGAGGLDLGLTIATVGYRTVCYVERDTYAAATLVARMEDKALDQAPVWDEVGTFDGCPWRGRVDIVSAGYPCQPFSVAGKLGGENDPRHLWPDVGRIIHDVEPPFVFLENVAHHLRLGFPEVASRLVGMGYSVAAGLFTAQEVGAPHRRERLFILASRNGDELANPARLLWHPFEWREPDGTAAALDDANGAGPQGRGDDIGEHAGERPAWPPGPGDADGWERFLRCAPDLEPAVRRGAYGLAHRVDRLRLCGNGVVPMVAAHALRTLAAKLMAPDRPVAPVQLTMFPMDD